MSDKTIIAWTQHTFNPWRGCTHVSPGCDNCYMFAGQRRWGRDPTVVVRTNTWGDPVKWNREARDAGRIDRVFTCSWSDWFHSAADAWRDEAWRLLDDTPHLDYQILTKRAKRIERHLPKDWGEDGYGNVWLGVSVESPAFLNRIDILRDIPAVVRFLSIEPLLEDVGKLDLRGIDWVIVGGESGPGFRDMPHEWAISIRDQCRDAGVAFFFKQSANLHTERGIELDGRIERAYPVPRTPKETFTLF